MFETIEKNDGSLGMTIVTMKKSKNNHVAIRGKSINKCYCDF